jgi:hypothetical protein
MRTDFVGFAAMSPLGLMAGLVLARKKLDPRVKEMAEGVLREEEARIARAVAAGPTCEDCMERREAFGLVCRCRTLRIDDESQMKESGDAL